MKEPSWAWDLYKTEAGNIPGDLLEFFVTVIRTHYPNRLPANPPRSVVTDVQAERLRRGIKFIEELGHEAFKDTNRFHRLGKDLYELRSVDRFGNPRWLFVRLDADRLVVFVHALFKQNNGALRAADRGPADARKADLERRRKSAAKRTPQVTRLSRKDKK